GLDIEQLERAAQTPPVADTVVAAYARDGQRRGGLRAIALAQRGKAQPDLEPHDVQAERRPEGRARTHESVVAVGELHDFLVEDGGHVGAELERPLAETDTPRDVPRAGALDIVGREGDIVSGI